MAKRRIKGYEMVRVNEQMALGTLADATVLAVTGRSSPEDGHSRWNYSFEGFVTIRGLTAGEGPILVGAAHGDYSVAEIKECLEAIDSNEEDQVLNEQKRRKVREWGLFAGLSSEEHLNGEQGVRKHKIKFSTAEGNSLTLFGYNMSGGTLTTGAIVEFIGKLHCRKY